MKTDFKARPVYLQTEDHIRAHFITCFISLVVYRILEKVIVYSYILSVQKIRRKPDFKAIYGFSLSKMGF